MTDITFGFVQLIDVLIPVTCRLEENDRNEVRVSLSRGWHEKAVRAQDDIRTTIIIGEDFLFFASLLFFSNPRHRHAQVTTMSGNSDFPFPS